MMMPSILGENLFDDFMNDFRFPATCKEFNEDRCKRDRERL